MASYAALVSLMNTMEQIQSHPRLSTSLDKYQIESLGERVGFFLDFIESYNSHSGISKEEVEDLEGQIASAAHAAEDIIESHIVGQILAGSTEKSPSFLKNIIEEIKRKVIKVTERIQSKDEKSSIQRVIEDMDTIKEKAIKVKEEKGSKDQQPTRPAAPSRLVTAGKTTVVGFDGYLTQLLDGLTGWQSDRQIIPITGMGGIGKTTLARSVYENLLIVQHFDVRAWISISQGYNVKKILSEILSCLGNFESGTEIEDRLGEKLHKILSGRRYLIILDDMWDVEAWDKIKFYLPDNSNRSRIIVTTRICSIATHFSSLALALNLLNDDQSWNVFCEKVFGEEGCPPELEKIGKKIVQKCRGLPLSIAVIGGLLRKSSRTQEYWNNVENDLSSILNSEDNQCFNILSLSYSHLPAYLKPCFLYLGVFSEDHKIRISHLIKLWIAEGFIKPKRDQSLEEIAESYIKDLVDRNLILVRNLRLNGEFKTCNIHDLLRDLCIKVAEREKFFYVMRELDNPQDIDRKRRIVIHGSISRKQYHNQVSRILISASFARSVISEGWCNILPKSKLLRVVHNVVVNSVTEQVNFRFLPFHPISAHGRSNAYKLHPSISLLWNLQTLDLSGTWLKVVAPSEIWEMPQLRHLESHRICLPDPPQNDERDGTILRHLQTLWTVLNFRCSEEACKRMPNIKKLHTEYGDFWGEGVKSLSDYCLYNVGRLNKLESLSYFFYKEPNRHDLLQNLIFPESLKKLDLYNCGLHWNDLRIIGSLPHLEVLKLHWNAVKGPEWNPIEGEFLRLKLLEIFSCTGLTYWNAESSHFPVLEKLVLQGLRKLDEIHLGVGEIPTLTSIVVSNCSISAAISAIKILEEQENLENHGLHVRIRFWDCMKLEEFRKIVEREGFTSRNFQFGLAGVQ